jgi:hypothetical protein
MSGDLGGIAFLPRDYNSADLMYDSTVVAPYIARPWFRKGEPAPEDSSGWWYKSMVPSGYPGELHIRVIPYKSNEQEQLMAVMSDDPNPDREITAILLIETREDYLAKNFPGTDGKEVKQEDTPQRRYDVKTTSCTTLSKLYEAARAAGAGEDDIIVHIALVHEDPGRFIESPTYKMIVEGRTHADAMGDVDTSNSGGAVVANPTTYMGRKINFGGGASDEPLHTAAPDIGRIHEILQLPLQKMLPALRLRNTELKDRVQRYPEAVKAPEWRAEIKEIENQKKRVKRRVKR